MRSARCGASAKTICKVLDPVSYSATQFIGKLGVERVYERSLHGQVGYQQVETDARGRVRKVLNVQPPVAGQNLTLQLDVRLQTGRDRCARRTPRRGRRDRSAHRRHSRDGQQSRVRPEPVRHRHQRGALQGAERRPADAAVQPRHQRPVRAGLDVQADGRGVRAVARRDELGSDDFGPRLLQAAGPGADLPRLELDERQQRRPGHRRSDARHLPLVERVLLRSCVAARDQRLRVVRVEVRLRQEHDGRRRRRAAGTVARSGLEAWRQRRAVVSGRHRQHGRRTGRRAGDAAATRDGRGVDRRSRPLDPAAAAVVERSGVDRVGSAAADARRHQPGVGVGLGTPRRCDGDGRASRQPRLSAERHCVPVHRQGPAVSNGRQIRNGAGGRHQAGRDLQRKGTERVPAQARVVHRVRAGGRAGDRGVGAGRERRRR